MRIPLLYRGEYSQWSERFMNYLKEQTDREAMINSIKNGDQPLPRVTQVSLTGTSSTEQPPLKDKSMWSDQEKKIHKIDRLARSLLIQGLPNDIYSLVDNNKTAKDLWDALARHMLASEYGEQDRKAVVLYEYETFKATEGELLLDTYIRYLQVINDLKKCGYSKDNCELDFKFLINLQPEWKQYATMMRQNKNLLDINIDALYNILKQNQGYVNDVMKSKKKAVMITSDPLALVAEQKKVSKRKLKVEVFSESEGSDDELKKITALLAKAFNQKKLYSKPTNNNLRTCTTTSSVNKKQEYVKFDDKKEEKKVNEKKRDMSKVKCYNCKKDDTLPKIARKPKSWIVNITKQRCCLQRKTKMNKFFLLRTKLGWNSEASSSCSDDKITEVSYYTSKSENGSKYETSDYYDNSTTYGLFVDKNDDQENFHDSSEFFSKNLIESQIDHNESDVTHNDSEDVAKLINQMIKEFDKKIAKYQKRLEKANQQSKDFENQIKFLQERCDVLQNQTNTFEVKNNELNEQIKVLIENNDDLLAQTKALQEQLKVKHVVINNHVECFKNPSYFGKAKDLRPSLYDEKVIGLGYTPMFLTHSDEALKIEKFKRAKENKIEFAYDYGNLNAKKIIIDLKDEVVSLLEKEKTNMETIESLKSKGFESTENAIFESENKSENDCQVVEKECDKVENSKVIAPGMFKLNVSQSVSPISMSKTSCALENVENKIKRKRLLEDLSIAVLFWKKKGSSNTSNVDLSSVSHLKLNKDVKRYSRKDLLSCNNYHLGETSSAYVCNDAMNVSCNSRLYNSFDKDNLFIFDDESVRNSQVSKMPFRKKPNAYLNVPSRSKLNKSLPRIVRKWLPKLQSLAEPVDKWIPKIVQIYLWIIDLGCLKHMTGNRVLLTNFVEKFLGTVHFGNNVFAVQLVDLFTKSLPEARFKFLDEKLGMMSREK
nr:hypothetical protein [Tanacetum cinerariifolium]